MAANCPGACADCGTCDVCGATIPWDKLPPFPSHTCGPCRASAFSAQAETDRVLTMLYFGAVAGRTKAPCATVPVLDEAVGA